MRNTLHVALFAVAAALCLAAGCTLILPTDQLIKSCVQDDDCDDGFSCEENQCLPIDVDDGADGEGE